ncbi:hypothetical protein H696_03939 [Fonticula alba]|uniref:Phosphatidic acid phosphatase type 2/haloperoxidase domain-containing protein n=1 Tax=Fonticula alba TaxID=691883 RepID=A0A058Z6J0_FONAL|nr:hypothetical protein H696_03939 [Fonticula alba]KCV69518.1 hypothetical protein H696_03939 [Fonticula alba]|eukprot:XP_009496083.1 hypothetical protein H696_03939 [Fonticula alba]
MGTLPRPALRRFLAPSQPCAEQASAGAGAAPCVPESLPRSPAGCEPLPGPARLADVQKPAPPPRPRAISPAPLVYGILCLVVILLSRFGWLAPLQTFGCAAGRRWREATAPFLPNSLLVALHRHTSTSVWIQLSFFLGLGYSHELGLSLYCFSVLGHVVKNFAKSFGRSPRSFWLCGSPLLAGASGIGALHCGSGYSLPSGHTMLSTMVTSYLGEYIAARYPAAGASASRKTRVSMAVPLWLDLLAERRWSMAFAHLGAWLLRGARIVIILNTLHLGTHTVLDIAAGLLFARFWTSAWPYIHQILFPTASKPREGAPLPGSRRWLLPMLALGGVCLLEVVEELTENQVSHPLERVLLHERNCSLLRGTGATRMANSSAFEKSALVLGVLLAVAASRPGGGLARGPSAADVQPQASRPRRLLSLGTVLLGALGVKLMRLVEWAVFAGMAAVMPLGRLCMPPIARLLLLILSMGPLLAGEGSGLAAVATRSTGICPRPTVISLVPTPAMSQVPPPDFGVGMLAAGAAAGAAAAAPVVAPEPAVAVVAAATTTTTSGKGPPSMGVELVEDVPSSVSMSRPLAVVTDHRALSLYATFALRPLLLVLLFPALQRTSMRILHSSSKTRRRLAGQ